MVFLIFDDEILTEADGVQAKISPMWGDLDATDETLQERF